MTNKDMTREQMWNKLREHGVSEETLQVVTDLNGYTKDTLEDVLWVCFGYHDFDDLRWVPYG